MNPQQWTAVDDYLCETLVGYDPALAATLKASDQAGLRPINVAPNQGKFLQLLARIRGTRQPDRAVAAQHDLAGACTARGRRAGVAGNRSR
jgi:predicted O-methyltransferase YrrM